MLRVAICNDNISEIEALCDFINKYTTENQNTKIQLKYFTTAEELKSSISSGEIFDCVFLDTEMPYLDSKSTSNKIQEINHSTEIVFLTNSENSAPESHGIRAITKPISQSNMNELLQSLPESQHPEITVKGKQGYIKIGIDTLEYIEVYNHDLYYHILNHETIKTRQKLSDMEVELAEYKQFIKPHRSYIINLDYVESIGNGYLTMKNGEEIPVAMANLQSVNDAFELHHTGGTIK